MVLRSLGHGYRVAIVQFIKGAWEPAEKAAFQHWTSAAAGEIAQLEFHAMGEGFTGKLKIESETSKELRQHGKRRRGLSATLTSD
jgi:ATP:corrinoid adenosyltransferase